MATPRPKLVAPIESRYCQIGEAWDLALSLEDVDTQGEVAVTSASLTLQRAGGSALAGPVSMTVVGGALSYTLSSGSVPTMPERSLRALVTAVVDGRSWAYLHNFDAVRFSPALPIGVADIGAQVADWNALATASDQNLAQIMRAGWEDVLAFMTAIVEYPDCVFDAPAVKRGVLYRTLELAYRRAAQGNVDDVYKVKGEAWGEEYAEWKKSTKLTVDVNEDGLVDEAERGRATTVVRLGRRQVAS